MIQSMSVEYNGKEYKVTKNESGASSLNLSGLDIKDITQVKGLDSLTQLQVLNLSRNKIIEIKGLDNLTNLVDLQLEQNKIEVIKDLDKLEKLQVLNLYKNNISQIESLRNKDKLQDILLGGNLILTSIKYSMGRITPKTIIKYSQMAVNERKKIENINIAKEERIERLERAIIRRKKRLRKTPYLYLIFECLITLGIVLGALVGFILLFT